MCATITLLLRQENPISKEDVAFLEAALSKHGFSGESDSVVHRQMANQRTKDMSDLAKRTILCRIDEFGECCLCVFDDHTKVVALLQDLYDHFDELFFSPSDIHPVKVGLGYETELQISLDSASLEQLIPTMNERDVYWVVK